MIDFKKKMEQDRLRKQKRMEDARLTVTGAIQTLLNLKPQPPKLSVPAQHEILVCQCCGHTWTSEEAEAIKKAWAQHVQTVRGPLCDMCWHLFSVMNQAHAQGRSLKEVLQEFLKGMARKTGRPFGTLWTEKN